MSQYRLGTEELDKSLAEKILMVQEPPGLHQELCCQQDEGSDPSHFLSAAETLLGSQFSFELPCARESYFS